MPSAKLKNYLHLHFLVFIAGFTAILGELISIEAIPLVWYRMVFALIMIAIFAIITKAKLRISFASIFKLSIAGIIIALHWITFFGSIKVSYISIALVMFSTGAFFASLIEPIIFKRKIIKYELVFGVLVMVGVYIVTQSEFHYLSGILLGILSAFLASLFTVFNGKFLEQHTATVITFYEFISGVIFISLYLLFAHSGFSESFFDISVSDLTYLLILASICTAYAFIASVYVMRYLSPYTVVLTYNLEPVYGIILAILLFPEKEQMSPKFYLGAFIIIAVVMLNGILKHSNNVKRKRS